jgi:hypothetical protein
MCQNRRPSSGSSARQLAATAIARRASKILTNRLALLRRGLFDQPPEFAASFRFSL